MESFHRASVEKKQKTTTHHLWDAFARSCSVHRWKRATKFPNKGACNFSQGFCTTYASDRTPGPGCRCNTVSGDQFVHTSRWLVKYVGYTVVKGSSSAVQHITPPALVRPSELRGTPLEKYPAKSFQIIFVSSAFTCHCTVLPGCNLLRGIDPNKGIWF